MLFDQPYYTLTSNEYLKRKAYYKHINPKFYRFLNKFFTDRQILGMNYNELLVYFYQFKDSESCLLDVKIHKMYFDDE